ncbi:protein kinase domain-containing protein [Streptomyces sp. NPDC054949]|uniref:protein kinase domain-containing protein n=1 Tax=unclassified Streptomyces TaxID=2593676 RepID=UPI0006AF3907|nr:MULTISPECIES: protein kinase [unclassified Streptomyces]KOU67696.1 serine/threonine protein kinase [Streptomyces sp. WM4235]MCX5074539.1 protein kinase [Streptomyces sp. NBC_00424]MCX5153932.1 protein kinase [Streptomyces sp. NBC_00291]WUD42284.1 protein kinase [Streptomyces sp. NBC_00513]
MAPEPEGNGAGMAEDPEHWGAGGLVGEGRYRLTHRLGRGGMAEVFAAEDVRLGRTVAVKLLRADLAEDPVSKARFTREAQSVAGLNHHAVVAVYDSGEDRVGPNVVPYIVMELVEGRTIRDLLISAEAPGPDQALIIVAGVLEALAYSHQHGIVHRDIKPANVIITDTGAVKVMDFGIARALHGVQSTMTQTGMVMGTPQYLSPEQALGKAVDHRSDLYATGCLLYELLALRPPFTGETPLSVVYQHVQDAPIPPSQLPEGHHIPQELDGLVMRSLAKDPDDRFQSAEEMRGLVQYALQMLHDQGPNTGTWNTGPVTMALPHGQPGSNPTTAMPQGGTGGQQYPQHATTSQFQQPMVPPLNPDDGSAFPGGGGYGNGRNGNGNGRGGQGGHGGQGGQGAGGGRWKMVVFALLAVLAIAGGVAYAVKTVGGNGGSGNEKKSPNTTQSSPKTPASSAETPADSPSAQSPDTPRTDDSGDEETYRPSPSRTRVSPSHSAPSSSPSSKPSASDEPSASNEPSSSKPTTSSKPSVPVEPSPPDGGGDGPGGNDDGTRQ